MERENERRETFTPSFEFLFASLFFFCPRCYRNVHCCWNARSVLVARQVTEAAIVVGIKTRDFGMLYGRRLHGRQQFLDARARGPS